MTNYTKTLVQVPYYLLIAGVAVIGLLLLATLVPIPGNFKVKIVQSGSMEPAIPTGSIVAIRPASTFAVGDVITFGPDTKTQIPTTHRIVEIKGEGAARTFVTKGDANDMADPKETYLQDIDGKVMFSVPYLGYILDFARKPLGFALIVGIPAAVVIFDELGTIWIEIQKMRNRKKKKDGINSSGSGPEELIKPHRITRGNVVDLRKIHLQGKEEVEHAPRKETSSFSWKALVIILLVIGPVVELLHLGGTIAYYNSGQASLGNILQASSDYETEPEATFQAEIETQNLVGEATTLDNPGDTPPPPEETLQGDQPETTTTESLPNEDPGEQSSTTPVEELDLGPTQVT